MKTVLVRFLLLATLLVGGCATMAPPVPDSWKEPIVPKVALPFEVERPWQALALPNAEGKLFSVSIPEEWYRWQFAYIPVKEPESKEIIPLQRVASRVTLLCDGKWINSSAVVNRDNYDVLIPPSCKEGDQGVILSGSGKHILAFGGEIVRDARVEDLMSDAKYRERFFRDHASAIRNPRVGTFPAEVLKQFNQVINVDGVRYRIGDETILAAMITVGSSIEERFLDCGGGDVNIVSAILLPKTLIARPAAAFVFCGVFGQPTGFFFPDDEFSPLYGLKYEP